MSLYTKLRSMKDHAGEPPVLARGAPQRRSSVKRTERCEGLWSGGGQILAVSAGAEEVGAGACPPRRPSPKLVMAGLVPALQTR